MSILFRSALLFCMLIIGFNSSAQQVLKGSIIDANTKEPLNGASVRCSTTGCTCGCASGNSGAFELKIKNDCCESFTISCVGYQTMVLPLVQWSTEISLQRENVSLQEIVVSAN